MPLVKLRAWLLAVLRTRGFEYTTQMPVGMSIQKVTWTQSLLSRQ